MTEKGRDQLTRWGKVLGILVGLTVLVGALRAAGDDRYVTQREYQSDQTSDSAFRASVTTELRYVACRQDKPRVDCLPKP